MQNKAVLIGVALFLSLFATAYAMADKKTVSTAQEAVTKIEPTDSGLADLEKLVGPFDRIFPRSLKVAQCDIVKITVKRNRFTRDKNDPKSFSELRWFDLINVPIEERIGAKHPRPWTLAVLTGGSHVRYPRNLDVKDVKLVIVLSGKTLRVIELI